MKKEVNTTDINKKPYFGPIPSEFRWKEGDTFEDSNRKMKAADEIRGWPDELTPEQEAVLGEDVTEANSGKGVMFGLGKKDKQSNSEFKEFLEKSTDASLESVKIRDAGPAKPKKSKIKTTKSVSETSTITPLDMGMMELPISLGRVPLAVEQLKEKGSNGSWAAFAFYTKVSSSLTADHSATIQFSIDKGVLGFDWVLLGERNIADKERVAKYIRSKGYKVTEQEMNEVGFLRVEDGDLVSLGMSIVKELYKLENISTLGLFHAGFEYQPPKLTEK